MSILCRIACEACTSIKDVFSVRLSDGGQCPCLPLELTHERFLGEINKNLSSPSPSVSRLVEGGVDCGPDLGAFEFPGGNCGCRV